MPRYTTKLVLGTLLILVRVVLKLKQLPEEDRVQLRKAESELEKEIVACQTAEEVVSEGLNAMVNDLIKKVGL